MTNANTIISLSLVLLAILITSTAIKSQRPALPFPFREENVEFLTSEEEERLIYGGNEKIIDEKIKDLPAERVMAPRPGPMARGDIIPGKPPVPTMDPALPKMVKRPMEHPPKQFRKVPPPKSTRGFPFRIPRVFLKNGGARNITPLKRKPRMKNQMPIPTYRARPSTLVSSEPDQLEVAVKRVEIMAARAGLNMSSMPRRTQMQVMKKLMPKLPPRMSNMVKEAMDSNPEKMYSFLPEPMKDFQENGKDDLRDEFAESINQPVIHHHHGNSHHHGQSGVKNYDAEKISIAHNHDDAEDESSFPHLPMTENFENGPSSGLMPPSDLAGHGDYASDFSDRDFEREAQYTVPATRINHHHDPIASPLVSELSDPMMAEGSDHVPFVISPGSLSKNSKASKIVSALKSITPSPVRVNLPSKDKYQIHTTTRKPIRVSIISNGKSDSTISPPPKQDPILKIIQIEQVPEDEDDLPAIIHEVKEQQQSDHVPNPDSTKIPFRPISLDIIRAEEDKYQIKEDHHKKEQQNSFNSMNKKENDFLFNINKKEKYTVEKTVPTTTLPITTTTTTTTTTEKVTTTNPPSTTTTTTTTTEAPLDLSKLDMFDDWESQPEEQWSDPYDLTDDEIAATVAELKKYETQGYLDNSLEQDLAWRLTPHPLEYPDHPDHPKDSIEEIIKSESESSDNKNKGNNNSNNNKPQPQTVSKRPNHPPGPPRRPGPPPPNVRRPPFRRPSGPPPMKRPPPPGPPNGGRRPPNPPLPPRRPPPRPMVINDVTVSEIPKEYSKECDYFSEDLCLVVQDYPIEAISEAMEQYSDASKLLVKEPDGAWVDGVPRSQENNYNFKHYFGQQRRNDDEMNSHRHRDFAGEGGFLCPSKVAYGQVKKARSSSNGDWKYVVNYGDNTQTLRLEKCLTPGNTCSYVMPHYRTACTQVYNYHRLLAWDSEKGLHVDVFKVPTCCTCHVQGYYIPQGQQGFTPAPRRPPRLNFSPPRTPMGRGGKKIPSSNTMIPTLLKPGLGVGKPVLSAPINEQTSPSPAATKELKDDLQDLLAQYSALRERIAKKKNTENVEVAYNVSSTSSNSTESLRPKTRESRTSQFPLKLKPLLQLKQLSEKLKKMKMKPTNISKPLLVKTSLKRPLARALLLAKLNRKIKAAKSAKVAKQNAATAAATRTSNARAMRTASGFPSGHSNTSSSSSSIKDRIQMLRSRLTKYNEKKPLSAKESISAAQKLREKSNRPPSGPRPQQQQHQSTQRSRLNQKPQSKVNYSYHPIMDYFNGKNGKKAT